MKTLALTSLLMTGVAAAEGPQTEMPPVTHAANGFSAAQAYAIQKEYDTQKTPEAWACCSAAASTWGS